MQKLISNESPPDKQKLIEKATKLKALLSSDQEGERKSANELLSKFMIKYEITWEDLDDEAERDYQLKYSEDLHKDLLSQICYMHLGSGHCYQTRNIQGELTDIIVVRSKPSTFVEIQLDWEFYWRKFQEELLLFYRAFVEQNRLFPPEDLQDDEDEDDNESMSEEEIRKVHKMMTGVDHYTRNKSIDDGVKQIKGE